MYNLYLLKTDGAVVGVGVSRGNKIARFFKMEYCDHDYYEEIGHVKFPWMVWAMFLQDYPDMMEMDRYIKDGMNLLIFLKKDGTQDASPD